MKRGTILLAIVVLSVVMGMSVLIGNGPGRASAAAASSNSIAGSALTPMLYRWEPISLPIDIASTPFTGLAVHPANAYTAYLSSWNGLYKTSDAGQSWSRVATSTLTYVPDMALTPSNPQRLFAVSWGSSLYRSDDGGNNWMLVASPPSICGLAAAPSNADRIYARGCGGPAVFRSDNAGQTWITPTLTFTTNLDALAVSPADSNVLIGADFDEVFRSGNGGAMWAKASIGTRYFGKPAFDP